MGIESFKEEKPTGESPEAPERKEGYIEGLKNRASGLARILTLAVALGLPLKGLEAGEKNVSPQEPTTAQELEKVEEKILDKALEELKETEGKKPSLTREEAAFEAANIEDAYIYSSREEERRPDPRLLELANGIKKVYKLTPQELKKGENEYKKFKNEQLQKRFGQGSLGGYNPSFAPKKESSSK